MGGLRNPLLTAPHLPPRQPHEAGDSPSAVRVPLGCTPRDREERGVPQPSAAGRGCSVLTTADMLPLAFTSSRTLEERRRN